MYSWRCTTPSSSICWRSISSMVLRYPDKQGKLKCLNLQVWDYVTGKLKKDLQYQADEQFMMHETAVLALNFSRDSELLVSGSQDGKIKVLHTYFGPHLICATKILFCLLQISRCTDAWLRHTITMSSPDSNSAALLCTVHSTTNTSSTAFQTCKQVWTCICIAISNTVSLQSE